jgi:hypothetical protein
MSTVFSVSGSPVAVPSVVCLDRLVVYCKGGMPSLSFSVRGGPLAGLPDPYLAKPCTLTIGGTLRFAGDITICDPSFQSGIGWVRKYQALGLRNRGDFFAHTDANNGGDTTAFNLAADNQSPDYLASNAGRTIGQILTAVLAMSANAASLAAFGMSTSGATVTDLAALTLVPPAPVYFGGERFLGAVESLLASWAPNHVLWVQPDGVLRFLDLRTFSAHTLTMGTDRVFPTALTRDCSNSFSQVKVRGSQIAEPFLFALSNTAGNGLSEAPFAWGGHSVSAAKALWRPSDWTQPGLPGSTAGAVGSNLHGTCTTPGTTSVVITSSDPTTTFPANFWDQTSSGRHAVVMLSFSTGTVITSYAARLVVANTAMTAGGTSTLTLDRPLPNLLFDRFTLTGTTKDASAVWCVYALPAWAGPKVAKQTTFPFAFHAASGLGVTMTSAPTGDVLYSDSGSPPFNEFAVPITVDPASGTVRFASPTFMTAGNHPPTDVRAVVPIYTGANVAYAPSSSTYAGTFYTIEGVSRTLTLTVPAWRDPANQTAMNAFAADVLDSVKDTVVEGSITYLGLYSPALAMGVAMNVAGTGYTTGWESGTIPALPVVECQVEWPITGPLNHVTTLRCSNRRGHLDSAAFLRPDRTGITWDFGTIEPRGFAAMGTAGNFGDIGGRGGLTAEAQNVELHFGTPTVPFVDATPSDVPRGLAPPPMPRGID